MQQELPKVRLAAPEDEPAIMEMCRRLHAENGLFTLNEAKVAALLQRYYQRDGVILGVIGPVGKPEASTCIMLSDYYYSDDTHLAELWNFVDKEYRKSKAAEALIRFGMECAQKMSQNLGAQCPFLTGIITDNRTAGKVRLYHRLLGHAAGAFFIYNAKWDHEPMEDHGALAVKLREAAKLCNDRKVTFEVAQRKIGPLLREAAEAVSSEDKIWGPTRPANKGAAQAAAS